MSIEIIPPDIVSEITDVLDHGVAGEGLATQMIKKGQTKSCELFVFPKHQKKVTVPSFQCRSRVRSGKGRRCRAMCRASFPYCRQHSVSKLGLGYYPFSHGTIDGHRLQGLIAHRNFKKHSLISAVMSVAQLGDHPEFQMDSGGISVNTTHPSLSTIARYAERDEFWRNADIVDKDVIIDGKQHKVKFLRALKDIEHLDEIFI